MQITCPYCFHTMEDTEVWFRSERVNQGYIEFIPEDYVDEGDFIARYAGDDKDEIIKKITDWKFFEEKDDETYSKWWEHFGGTTEDNPADDFFGVKAYRRPLLNPNKISHQKYLKRQPDSQWFIFDKDGMASAIELKTGERCTRRVCRKCHNPLPNNYGKSPARFVSIIGVTGAGKTVYLSQLLRNMRSYCAKVGLSAYVRASSSVTFLEKNPININAPLPGSTPANRLQQPLFYELVRADGQGGNVTETFVLYDVAGEIFDQKMNDDTIKDEFAPFLQHSDGLVVLIRPNQFQVIGSNIDSSEKPPDAAQVLDALHTVLVKSGKAPSDMPCAVCISKIDEEEVQRKLDSKELQSRLKENVTGIRAPDGLFLPCFNAKQYNPIAYELDAWVKENEAGLGQMLKTEYRTYSYFALTALGCSVEPKIIDGVETSWPIGPIDPHRVEEPLLWLFHKLGYIATNEHLFDPAKPIDHNKCPDCGSYDIDELYEEKHGLMARILRGTKIRENRCCKKCGHKWSATFTSKSDG